MDDRFSTAARGDSFSKEQGDLIVRHIASFLTVSDAASLMSNEERIAPRRSDSWAVGVDMGSASEEEYQGSEDEDGGGTSWEQQLAAPQTPAFISISPGASPSFDYSLDEHHHITHFSDEENRHEELDSNDDDYDAMQEILWERRRRWVQQRLAAAVYSHPGSVRSFCLQAYQSARDIMKERSVKQPIHLTEEPETSIEPLTQSASISHFSRRRTRVKRRKLVSVIAETLLNNVPLSVFIDVLEALGEVALDTTFATYTIVTRSLDALVQGTLHMLGRIWHCISNFNPFHLLEAIVSFQFNAMGKTSEVLASGIQSVATGVGSASSLALHRLSAANLSVTTRVAGGASSSSLRGETTGLRRSRSNATVLNDKLLRKLSTMNDAARVVLYVESEDDTGGLTKQARSKVQRMMHYEVSLRPFVATVQGPSKRQADSPKGSPIQQLSSVASQVHLVAENDRASCTPSSQSPSQSGSNNDSSYSYDSSNNINSPFMYTPQSFPPTPHSRQIVMARGGRFADDVVFLARDRLRLHDSLESENERTREMAKLLREGKRLAVFNARDTANGIELTCGQHIATKAGNMLYCTTRSMVPVFRNCLVYFEMTVLPKSFSNITLQPSMTTLSIGLSTEEMPANALVGAWQGSCGLCTTGQIFAGGEWCTPLDPTVAAYSDGATIGCLVYLDDASAVDTWEGVLVNATVTFNVNGFLVALSPMGAATSNPLSSTSIPTPGNGFPQSDTQGLASSAVSPKLVDSTAERNGCAVFPQTPPTFDGGGQNPITLSIKVPAAEELYPTVTLHSPATSVMSRFSAEDIVASSRETIGAPANATVYAVDGSVIFD
ncbi:hypothetical protein ACA910_010635 [Epithemia clementina (nom. ined.)]